MMLRPRSSSVCSSYVNPAPPRTLTSRVKLAKGISPTAQREGLGLHTLVHGGLQCHGRWDRRGAEAKVGHCPNEPLLLRLGDEGIFKFEPCNRWSLDGRGVGGPVILVTSISRHEGEPGGS